MTSWAVATPNQKEVGACIHLVIPDRPDQLWVDPLTDCGPVLPGSVRSVGGDSSPSRFAVALVSGCSSMGSDVTRNLHPTANQLIRIDSIG
jgi:hypothetical protein